MYGLMMMIVGALAGAGAMFFMDPRGGGRRRALLRDQMTHLRHEGADAVDAAREEVKNRAQGVVAETKGRMQERRSDEPVADQQLEARVRSELGRHTSHMGTLAVRASEGVVTLSGPILQSEVDQIVSAAEKVRGVKQVENQLEVHESPEDIPALQG